MPPDLSSNWVSYGGHQFREVERLRFEFRSRSSPGTTYITDIEDRTCSCWPHTRRTTATGVCCHFATLKAYMRRMATLMNQMVPEDIQHTDQ